MKSWVKVLEEEFNFLIEETMWNKMVSLPSKVKTKRRFVMKRILLPFLLVFLIPLFANAQSELNNKLKDIKGKVDEIIIKSGGKEYKFSGEEAENLFARFKQENKLNKFQFFTNDGKVITSDSLKKKIIIKNSGDEDLDDNVLVFINENGDRDTLSADLGKLEKKVMVTENDGKKLVTVTTNENGKENVEVYEGKAADEYLDKLQKENDLDIKVNIDNSKKLKKIIIEKKEKKE